MHVTVHAGPVTPLAQLDENCSKDVMQPILSPFISKFLEQSYHLVKGLSDNQLVETFEDMIFSRLSNSEKISAHETVGII
jgi:hypothetical protein